MLRLIGVCVIPSSSRWPKKLPWHFKSQVLDLLTMNELCPLFLLGELLRLSPPPPHVSAHISIQLCHCSSQTFPHLRSHTLTHTRTHTHHMVECQTAARPEVMWQGIVLQKVMMMKIMMIASAHNSKNELPPCLDVYVCTNCVRVCVFMCGCFVSACKPTCYCVRVSVCHSALW